jgi:hypothetical protein
VEEAKTACVLHSGAFFHFAVIVLFLILLFLCSESVWWGKLVFLL